MRRGYLQDELWVLPSFHYNMQTIKITKLAERGGAHDLFDGALRMGRAPSPLPPLCHTNNAPLPSHALPETTINNN